MNADGIFSGERVRKRREHFSRGHWNFPILGEEMGVEGLWYIPF